jgi:hypothetical protein
MSDHRPELVPLYRAVPGEPMVVKPETFNAMIDHLYEAVTLAIERLNDEVDRVRREYPLEPPVVGRLDATRWKDRSPWKRATDHYPGYRRRQGRSGRRPERSSTSQPRRGGRPPGNRPPAGLHLRPPRVGHPVRGTDPA